MHACACVLHARAHVGVYILITFHPFTFIRINYKENKLKSGFREPVKGSGERLFQGLITFHPSHIHLSHHRNSRHLAVFASTYQLGDIPNEVIRVSLMSSLPLVESSKQINTVKYRTADSPAEGSGAVNPYARDILFVATNLDSFEADDVRYGYELMVDTCYRQLDPTYYAWLRNKMVEVKQSYGTGRMKHKLFEALRTRFNIVHEWAVRHFGEDALLQAINTLEPDTYTPPSEDTYNSYWKSVTTDSTSTEAKKLRHLLDTQGYGVLRTLIFDDVVVIVKDETISLPAHLAGKVTFTLGEVKELIGINPDALKTVCEVKRVFGGHVVPADDGSFNIRKPGGDIVAAANLQQSLFDAGATA